MAQKLYIVIALLCALAGVARAADNGWDIQATTSGNVTTFTISRTNTAVAETVMYRLVNLSAYAGQHYNVTKVDGQSSNALSGNLSFAAGDGIERTERQGQKFVYWTDIGVNSGDQENCRSVHALTVEPSNYITAHGSETVAIGGTTYHAKGSSITLNRKPRDGYTFDGYALNWIEKEPSQIYDASDPGYREVAKNVVINAETFTMPAGDATVKGVWRKKITITTASGRKLYDGTPLTTSATTVTALSGDGYSVTAPIEPVLEDGDNIELTFPSITDAGSIQNRHTVVIRNSSNEDVTANYDITFNVGTLTVLKRSITLSSANGWKIYDGNPLTKNDTSEGLFISGDGFPDGEGATISITGSQTEVGSSENTIEYTLWEGTKAGNYDITVEPGTLNVVYYRVLLSNDDQDGNNIWEIEDATRYPKVEVELQSRVIYKNGYWNTLCLPFSVALEGSPLEGADIRTLSSASLSNDGVLTLNFTPAAPADGAVTAIEAGVPYIIRWTKPDPYTPYDPTKPLDDCSDIYQPLFQGVHISEVMNPVHCDFTNLGFNMYMEFMGTYQVIYWDGPHDVLYLGANNKLYYPITDENGSPKIGACRAYFNFSWSPNAYVRAFNLNFGDDETGIGHTGITEITEKTGEWYTLDGVKIDTKPTKKGLYIVNGKKVVIP